MVLLLIIPFNYGHQVVSIILTLILKRKSFLYDWSTMTYDPVGNMSSLTNANGEIISYEYDKLNRLSKKILPDETFTMTYAAIGVWA